MPVSDLLLRGVVYAQVLAQGAPNPAPKAVPGMEGVASTLISWCKWGAIIVGVILIIVGGISYGAAKAGGNPKGQGGAVRAIGSGVAVVFIASTAAFWIDLAKSIGDSAGG